MLPGRLVLLGHPVSHSLSPAFQGAALRAAGLPLTYEALDVTPHDLGRVTRLLVEANGAGNVTVPHKEAFAELCDERTPLAQRVGAVNCFWVEDGRLVGDNTDVGGFDAAFRRDLGDPPEPATVAILGAGGAAAAVLAAIERWPQARARLWGRTPARARALAQRFHRIAQPVDRLDDALADADVVINATPLGLAQELPVHPAALPPHAGGAPRALFDLTYSRLETPLVLAARAAGWRACDGLGMLIEQGALAFERWFGRHPDRAAMWAAVRR